MVVFWALLAVVRLVVGDSVIDSLTAALAGIWVGFMVFRAMRRRNTRSTRPSG
jgi:hypothetical protein